MYKEIADKIKRLSKFEPYARACEVKAWEAADKEWREETIKLAESFAGFDFPSLLATDFMDFSRTGNRVRYEDKLFSKRKALGALVMAECAEHNGRFTDDIINGIFSICEESAWQLPAHNSYERSKPQELLPDASAPVLDLFACEAGAVLATAYYLLKTELDAVSPFICRRIEAELKKRVLEPYVNKHFWWMGNGKEPMNNWTIWCTQNVLLTAFLTDAPDAMRLKILKKACKSTDYFLDEYGMDGCCDEGAQYYRHAGLCLFNVTEILNAVTDGEFADCYKDEKIKNIAAYILNVHVGDKYYVNFADCSPIAGRAGAREFLFAVRTENAAMSLFAARDFNAGKPQTLTLSEENNLYYRLQTAFAVKRMKTLLSGSGMEAVSYPDMYYESAGLFIARDETFFMAVKAGDNDDSHNHNDTGSFTVYKNGKPLFIDVGVESYTKKTFSSQRYEIWTMQSDYHNLPTINGFMQHDGEKYKARDVKYHFDKEVCEIELDIADAYPAESKAKSYKRHASLVKGQGILIEDTFELENIIAEPVILNLMTYENPRARANAGGLSFEIGTLGRMHMKGAQLLEIEAIPITDARLMGAWEHEIYRIRVAAKESTIQLHIF